MTGAIITTFYNEISIIFDEVVKYAEITVKDKNGNTVLVEKSFNTNQVNIAVKFDAEGIFNVTVKTEKDIFNKRIFIKKK
jgi:hypothetical protein